MASLEIIEACEGRENGKPCEAQKKVRIRKADGTIIGEFCRKCGHKELNALAQFEKKKN